MPIGFGAPAARVSTLIVDAGLDMGHNTIKAKYIDESIPDFGVRFYKPIYVDNISELGADAGTTMPDLIGRGGLRATASAQTRISDTTERPSDSTAGGIVVYSKLFPAKYVEGSSCRLTYTVRCPGTGYIRARLLVNGAVKFTDDCTSSSYVTYNHDITVNPLDLIEITLSAYGSSETGYTNLSRISCDDTLEQFALNQAWL
jgi:hypothetical protein